MRLVRIFEIWSVAAAIFVILAGIGPVVAPATAAEQPIAFNHKAHVSKGLDCAICHRYVREQAFATLPTLQTCLMCHSAKMSDNPEEGKIREFAKRGEALRWVRLYRLTPDAAAYFSHRRHVALGRIECASCHGPMAEQTKPPPKALVSFSMDFCLNCHQQKKVSAACADCHR
jgi:predicted CXXCH cytochrome family protein